MARSVEDLLGPPAGESPRQKVKAPSRSGGRGDYALVGGAYEGASYTNRDLALWSPQLRSADADILNERNIATARARDVLRNDAYVQAGEQLHRDGVVGSFFALNVRPNLTMLGLKEDDVWETEFQEEVENKFTLWAESPENWPDASRANTLTGLVRLAVGVYLASGEVLATAEYLRASASRPFQTAVQMIESERLENPFGALDTTGRMRGGVERDRNGAPINYFIRDSHASDLNVDSWKWTSYPARMAWGRQRVIHIFEQARIDQSRGVSGMVTALKEMRVTKKFRDIMLQNAVVNATFAASIEAEMPEQAYEAIGSGDDDNLMKYAQDYLGMVTEYAGGSKSLTLDGVRIPHLLPGQKLQLRPAGSGSPLGTEFEASLLRYIAANLGVSYEELSRDYSQSNYSSMRAALIQTWKYMTARKVMVADRFATSVYRLWFEEAVNKGMIETMKGKPDFYLTPLHKDAYTRCDWLGAGRGQIDELKETQAAVLRMNNNIGTLEDEMGKQGKDWRAVLKQRAREKKMIEDLDLVPIENQQMLAGLSSDEKTPNEDDPDKKETKKKAVK